MEVAKEPPTFYASRAMLLALAAVPRYLCECASARIQVSVSGDLLESVAEVIRIVETADDSDLIWESLREETRKLKQAMERVRTSGPARNNVRNANNGQNAQVWVLRNGARP